MSTQGGDMSREGRVTVWMRELEAEAVELGCSIDPISPGVSLLVGEFEPRGVEFITAAELDEELVPYRDA